MSVVKEALRYLDMKWSVIPLRPQSKQPAGKWQEFQNRRMSPDELTSCLDHRHQHNVGIVTGRISQLVVYDADDAAS